MERRSSPPILPYDDFSSLLGGARWDDEIERRLVGGWPEVAENAPLLRSRFGSAAPFYLDAVGARATLEVFALKWSLFTELCRGIRDLCRTRAPSTAVRLSLAWVELPELANAFVPSRWMFAVRAATPDDPAAPAGAAMTREQDSTVLLRSVERMQESSLESPQGYLEAHLQTELPGEGFAARANVDAFAVTVTLPDRRIPSFTVWSTRILHSKKGVLFRGLTSPMSAAAWAALEKDQKKSFSGSKIVPFHSAHITEDLYALGTKLRRALLVNDEQTSGEVDKALVRIEKSMEPEVREAGADEEWTLVETLRGHLKRAREFARPALLFRREDREKADTSVPTEVWYDALILAVRLMTGVPGLSLVSRHQGHGVGNVQEAFDRAVVEAEDIEERIRAELFGAPVRNREILEAVDLVRREVMARGEGG